MSVLVFSSSDSTMIPFLIWEEEKQKRHRHTNTGTHAGTQHTQAHTHAKAGVSGSIVS